MAVILNASTTAGLVTSADTSGNLDLQAGGVTKIAVTSAGVAVTGLAKASLPTGSVLQVVNSTWATTVANSSTSYVTTNLTATITPTSATSKILINFSLPTAGGGQSMAVTVFRGTTAGTNLAGGSGVASTTPSTYALSSATIFDSPATTSAQVYTVAFKQLTAGTGYAFYNGEMGTITLMEIAA